MANDRISRILKKVGLDDTFEVLIAVPILIVVATLGITGGVGQGVQLSAILSAVFLLLLLTVRNAHRLARQTEHLSDAVQATSVVLQQISRLDERFPLEYISGHSDVEKAYRRILNDCTEELVVLGYGIDLSSAYWTGQIESYLSSTELLLERCQSYFRIQALAGAPIEWLRYLKKLQQTHPSLQVVFIDSDMLSSNRSIFQLFVADQKTLGIFVNIEVVDESDEFAIRIEAHSAVDQIRRHLLTVVAPKCSRLSDRELANAIDAIETERTAELRYRAGERMKILLRRSQRFLPWTNDLNEFRRLCPDVPDEYLHSRVMMESFLIWDACNDIDISNSASAIFESWMAHGQMP